MQEHSDEYARMESVRIAAQLQMAGVATKDLIPQASEIYKFLIAPSREIAESVVYGKHLSAWDSDELDAELKKRVGVL